MSRELLIKATKAAQLVLSSADGSRDIVVDGRWGSYTDGAYNSAPMTTKVVIDSIFGAFNTTTTTVRDLVKVYSRDDPSWKATAAISRSSASSLFLNNVLPQIIASARARGYAAPGLPAAQAQLESGTAGKVSGKNNYAGLKATSSQSGSYVRTTEYVNGQKIATTAKFRNFESITDFVEGYLDYLERKYPGVKTSTTTSEFSKALKIGKQGGYATDPRYAAKLSGVYDKIVA